MTSLFSRRGNVGRRAVTGIAALAFLGGVATVVAPDAEAGQASGTAMQALNVRSQPTAASQLLRTIPANAKVGLNCWTSGQAVTGKYGTTTIWYSVDGGGWVTDAGVYTGTNSAVTSRCGGSAPAPAAPSSGRKVGAKRATNPGISGYCTWGAADRWRQATGYYPALSGNAKDWAGSASRAGWTVVPDAQSRSIVVFQPGSRPGIGGYGHVGWVDQTQRRADGLWLHYVDMNGSAGFGKWSDKWIKDGPGMSYILAP